MAKEARIAPGQPRLVCLPPQPYVETLSLAASARLVGNDHGRIRAAFRRVLGED